jgi:hypothetical protein
MQSAVMLLIRLRNQIHWKMTKINLIDRENINNPENNSRIAIDAALTQISKIWSVVKQCKQTNPTIIKIVTRLGRYGVALSVCFVCVPVEGCMIDYKKCIPNCQR